MTTATDSTTKAADQSREQPSWKVLLPYSLAIIAQLPMLALYFKMLWSRPHYQPFAIAIAATIGIAWYRWPFGQKQPFHRSVASNVLLIFGLGFAAMGVIFVEPWFAALSVMLIVASLFARTIDKETKMSLWPCALPLFVYLIPPDGMDIRLISKLQLYSAIYTSRILDLLGLGHYMDGTVISIPNMKEYGIEEACSGVQSFFTLMLIAVIFIVMSRRLSTPKIGSALLAIFLSGVCFLARSAFFETGIINDLLLMAGLGLILFTVVGFRATALVLSAVFWAVFINTIRILTIPLVEFFLQIDLSEGFSHDILGYSALILGILLLLSTDQFLFFFFGPVDPSSGEAGPLGRSITKFWNKVLSGEEADDEGKKRKSRSSRRPVSASGYTLLWVFSGLMIAMGLWQIVDVQRSLAQTGLTVRFFDADVMVAFNKSDLPDTVDSWKQVDYKIEDRSSASDLGQRSDIWQFTSPRCAAVASLDQTFPGWHELTTCYRNQGWKLIRRSLRSPSKITGEGADDSEWNYIEATFEKSTGEKGYLLFSHFDSFGNGLDVPGDWGLITSLWIRGRNRMSHRIRAELFQGEAYQIQVFLNSYKDLDEDLKTEVNERYLEIRDEIHARFMEKRNSETNP